MQLLLSRRPGEQRDEGDDFQIVVEDGVDGSDVMERRRVSEKWSVGWCVMWLFRIRID